MTDPVARFAAALDALVPEGRLALAVSGGPDSLAMLLLAAQARHAGVIAATVDHGLRAAAADEAAVVARLAADLGVPHAILRVTVSTQGEGVQAAARSARYSALADWAGREGAVAIATAHHADDQAETLLMRLARGSGLAGLAGVRRSRPLAGGVRLVRPLLDWRKAELAQVVAEAGLTAADDPTNRDPAHDRTGFRGLLAREPLLNPVRVAQSAAHLGEAEAALEWMAGRLWQERVEVGGDGLVLDLAGLPQELRHRLLRRALPDARGSATGALEARLANQSVATLGDHLIQREGNQWRITQAPPRRFTTD
jgi:tRNA(Ile)-lysidine synthase